MAVVLLLASACGGGNPGPPLTQAELWVGQSAQPPSDTARWQPVTLPDEWRNARRRIATEGWYRLRLPRPTPDAEPSALFVPRIYPNAAFYVNGVEIGRGGRMQPPIARNAFRPLYFAIPTSLWRDDGNWLLMHFVGTPGSLGRVEPIFVGPASELLPALERMRFFHAVLPQLSALLCLVLAAAFLAAPPARLGGQRWFAAGLGCIAATTLSAFLPDAPLPNRAVEWIVGSALQWSVLLFTIGICRRGGEQLPGERLLLSGYVALSLVFAWVPGFDAGRVWLPWGLVSLAVGVYAGWRLLLDAWHGRARGLAVAGLAGIAAVLLDQVLTRLGVSLAGGPSLMAIVPVLFLLGFGGSLLATLLNALRESEALNRTLDARVAAREDALRASERVRALAEERNRLMRDVHDGTGGKLVTALSLVRSGRATPTILEDTLADALDDLNLTIHSLRPDSADLPGVLGLLRARLERQTRAHGVRLEWAIGDAGEGAELSPERAMHVTRIVQEAVANVLRHAGAASVRIASGGEDTLYWFEIADDGRGGAAPREGGRGLANLAQRAQLLGGVLALASDPTGTRVRVTLSRGGS